VASQAEPAAAAGGDSREGLLCGAGAFVLWGIYPFYFKALAEVPALEIVVHRIVWSTPVLALLLLRGDGWAEVARTVRDWHLLRGLLATTLLIATNWLVYVLAVTGGQVLDASLGYYMCPLVSVVLGVVVLKERLTRVQIMAVGLVALAVVLLIATLGVVPKVALFLAASFGLYGLFRKRLPVAPAAALFLECALLLPVALLLLAWFAGRGELVGPAAAPWTFFLLAMAGVVTVGPLLLFGMGAKRLRLTTVGLLQYITPTMLLVEGVLWFGEALNPWRLLAFALIWAALALYTWEGLRQARGRT
jgi:chloramphenicol-sensitive protein RarD